MTELQALIHARGPVCVQCGEVLGPHDTTDVCSRCQHEQRATYAEPDNCVRCGKPAQVNDGDEGLGDPVCARCWRADSGAAMGGFYDD